MSEERSLAIVKEFSDEDKTLIKQTVAKGATDQELKLFLYRCKNMGLDPLKPGQIHFVKYGSSPGTIVIGIEGFRTKAAKTGKHVGTKRGVIRDDNGKCIGAWCDVFRSDWAHPAHEEVSLQEYNSGKGNWVKMPETMIKKVAEVAALRMAFPDELGGLYAHEEMDQAKPVREVYVPEVDSRPDFEGVEFEQPEEIEPSLGDYTLKAGKKKGLKLQGLDREYLATYLKWYQEKKEAGNRFHQDVDEDAFYVAEFLKESK